MGAPGQIDYNALAAQARQSAPVDYGALASQARAGAADPFGVNAPGVPAPPLPSALRSSRDPFGGAKVLGGPVFPADAIIPTAAAYAVDKVGQWMKGPPKEATGKYSAMADKPVLGAPVIPRPAPGFAGEGLPSGSGIKPGVAILKNAYANAVHVDPVRNVIKALRPTSANADFIETAPGALSDIKSMEDPASPISSNEDFRAHAQAYLDHNRTAMDAYEAIPHAIGASVEGSPITRAMLDAGGDMLKLEDPEAYAALERKAQSYDRPFTLRELKNLHQEGNKRLNGFWNASPDKQAAHLGAGLNPAVEEAKVAAIRDLRYQGLDPENNGAGPREINRRYGAVADLLNASNKRRNAVLGEQPESPFIGLREDILHNTRLIRHGTELPKNSDGLIRRAMANVEPDGGHPSPPDTPGVAGYLGPGPIVTPPPEDTSFVRGAPAMTQPPNPQRALPPASTRFAGSVPDHSGARGVPAQPGFKVGFPQKALPPATSTPRGSRTIGSKHGDILIDPLDLAQYLDLDK